MLDPWYGAQGCVRELVDEGLTRADYLEHGGDRIKHHKYGKYKHEIGKMVTSTVL